MAQEHDSPVDPVFASSLREFKWILLIWLVFFLWVIGYCYAFGYPDPETPLVTVIGMPSWVFWGIFLPWIAATLASTWFALTQIKDHPLPDPPSIEAAGEQPVKEESQHE